MNVNIGHQYRLIGSIEHQGIGGQVIRIEMEVTPDEIDKRAMEGNPACYNFAIRRDDFLPEFNKKCYYGKVGFLGYVVCEDEIVEEVL